MFSAQVMTVRGDMNVDMSPTRNPLRVMLATATIRDDARPRRLVRHPGRHDRGFDVRRQVVERRDDVPAVDLGVVEPLRSVVEAVMSPARRCWRWRRAGTSVRRDHAVLVQQRQFALVLEDALDHEHHVRPAGVVLVENSATGRWIAHGRMPSWNSVTCWPSRSTIASFDQVHPADLTVQIDAHTRPIQPRGNLFDVARLAGAVQALQHHTAIAGETREDRQRRVAVEAVCRVDVGYVLARLAECRHFEIAVDAEVWRTEIFMSGAADRRLAWTPLAERMALLRRFPVSLG